MSMARILSSVIKTGRSRTTTSSRRFLCSSTSLPKDPYSSSSSSAFAGTVSSAEHVTSATPPPPPPPRTSRSPWIKLLKFSVIGAFTSAVATAGYTTYAYSLDEVDRKTKSFRDSVNFVITYDSSTIAKIQATVRSKAMKVCVDTIELYLNTRRAIEEHVWEISEPSSDKLLPDMHPEEDAMRVVTLVLDLNDTLIYSDWKRDRGWRTYKRPGLDDFLEDLSRYFEIVLYTDQMDHTVEEIVRCLNPKQYIRYYLSRADTKYWNGKHYRDLSKLNRDPSRIIYVSAHALESCLQPENSVQIKPWTADDVNDTALLDLIPFLRYIANNQHVVDTRKVIATYEGSTDIGKEYIERVKEARRQRLERQRKPRGWLFQR